MDDQKSVLARLCSGIVEFFTDFLSKGQCLWGVIAGVTLLAPFAAESKSPDYVDLRTSGNFTILAKTGISVTGPSAIVGDIGVSPVAATYITGFGLIADASTAFSTSSLVTGKVYASDFTDPTPMKMTTAISDMETAYTDAVGRTLPDFTELYTGELTGKTLVPGLYKWSTGVLVGSAGVTISGGASDVWIFQIAQNLELASGAMVTLSGAAQSSNIFWQVAGQVTLGTTAAMQGIILCQTAIVMNTGATLTGRALAQTAVTLDANTVISPAALTAVKYASSLQIKRPELTYANKSVCFTVSTAGMTTLKILNVCGQEIASLFNENALANENYRMQFTPTKFAKGVYIAKLETGGMVNLKKLQLVN
jgi:hypothetical protein